MSSLSGLGMAQEEHEHSLEEKFAAAVKVIRSLPEEGPFQPSDDLMLMFYSYYKQATVGPCNVPRPMGFWDNRGKIEWDAWSSLGNMTKEEAMTNYIEDIQLILETIPISDDVSELVQKLGNFYTEVDGEEEEGNEVDKRPFTRPFVGQEEELVRSIKKPTMEGYGGLWDDIQNVQEQDKHSSVLEQSFSSEEAEGSRESSQIERKEESSDWRRSEEDGDEDVKRYDGDKEEDRDSSPDPRFLMVDDRRWRSDTKGSNSSVEPSMSSFTNGTHSSLNSEVEEEELACSLESSVQYNPYMLFNGHFSDHSDAAPDSIHRSADSDNEEFCDSMEHLAMERLSTSKSLLSPGSGAASVRPNDLWFESSTTLKEAEDEGLTGDFCHQDVVSPNKLNSSLSRRGRGSPSPQSTCSSPRCVDAAGGGFTQSRHPVKGNVSEQIAAALLRLQGDMADVLHRLHTLEELSKSQSRSSSPRQEGLLPVARKFLRPSWWPFDSSPLTLALTALWPLITHLLFQLYLQRKRRKTM
ncbi:acyl-CoA-binding domain-containing protein 5A-like isoform X1 [Melanotaenia boesemani]|uniref:acyl-CoA-binding domain-containing protein 5A-like isoform X1 n=2 Tax=Melanotaenia boesemani TaxID=1250792 RepID=UPI001C04ADFA|nr:acyl-CoA-binding domain-containing protein 5A-like isoform X1 [Melanotaenia boesemani]XP_041848082.1 acyl-CoA-binding domain-containing protein 5A-like isoform X1 [Melanotaenia boesemani]XP_041848084.1 acyl-CoA-binding domain-containing protein 5A-like isoform X1 [Melanotaenia boesemani]